MYNLELHFTGSTDPQLEKFVVSDGISETPRISFRGKTPGAHQTIYTFQWTRGIIALCVFLIDSRKSFLLTNSSDNYQLSGHVGSLAASLDYSIAKAPLWTHEVFGSDLKGNTLLRRIIKRSNPERRRPGPVVLSLNPKQLSPSEITIFCDNIELNTPETLCSLVNSITKTLPEQIFESTVDDSEAKIFSSQFSGKYQTSLSPSLTETFLSNNYRRLHFRSDWLPIINGIVMDTQSIIRGTVYDTEVPKWWSTISGQLYFYTNLLMLSRGITIKRLFLLTSENPEERITALLHAYIHEQLGIEVAICKLEDLSFSGIVTSPMISIHDSFFSAVHSPRDLVPSTEIETRQAYVTEMTDLYDSFIDDDRISHPVAAFLKTVEISPALFKEAQACVKHLRKLSLNSSISEILAKQTVQ